MLNLKVVPTSFLLSTQIFPPCLSPAKARSFCTPLFPNNSNILPKVLSKNAFDFVGMSGHEWIDKLLIFIAGLKRGLMWRICKLLKRYLMIWPSRGLVICKYSVNSPKRASETRFLWKTEFLELLYWIFKVCRFIHDLTCWQKYFLTEPSARLTGLQVKNPVNLVNPVRYCFNHVEMINFWWIKSIFQNGNEDLQ